MSETSSSLSKSQIKQKIANILMQMSEEFPLSNFAEKIEEETSGKFTFTRFRQMLENYYPKLPQMEKIFLLKYISLSALGVTNESALISLPYLFNFFEKILGESIMSPSLILYKVADILKIKFNMSTIEFIKNMNLDLDSEISMDEFYNSFSDNIQIDDITSIVLFKGVDLKKTGKIKIRDLVLVIDSFRDDFAGCVSGVTHKTALFETAKKLKIFFDENFISVDRLFEGAKFNYLFKEELKKRIMSEIRKIGNLEERKESEEVKIGERDVEEVIDGCRKGDKVYKEDFRNLMPKSKEDEKQNGPKINLNDTQKYWINRYLEILKIANITAKMAFDVAKDNKNNLNLEDLKKQLKILVPNHQANTVDLNNMMDSLDVNRTQFLSLEQYNEIISYMSTTKENNFNKKYEEGEVKTNNDVINLWTSGVKSTSYHLLPVKGNYRVLQKLNEEIAKNLFYEKNNKDEKNSSNGMKNGKSIKVNNYVEENINGDNIGNGGNSLKNSRIKDSSQISGYKYVKQPFSNSKSDIEVLETFEPENIYFPSLELYNFLCKKKLYENKSTAQFIKELDKDCDGYISLLDIINYELDKINHRSTKFIYKYLAYKIHENYQSSEVYFTEKNIDIYAEVNPDKLCRLFEELKINRQITYKLIEELKIMFEGKGTYSNLCSLIEENYHENNDKKYLRFETFESLKSQKYSNIKTIEYQVKKIIRDLLNSNKEDDLVETDYLRSKKLKKALKTLLAPAPEEMTKSDFIRYFVKKLNVDFFTGFTIFQCAKNKENYNNSSNIKEKISKTSLETFLEGCMFSNENGKIIETSENSDTGFQSNDYLYYIPKSQNRVASMVYKIESAGLPLRIAFEQVKFHRNGCVPVYELVQILDEFYGNRVNKRSLINLCQSIDEHHLGIVDYSQLQMFLFAFSKEKFSIKLEFESIACNLVSDYFIKKKDLIKSSRQYFMSKRFKILINNFKNITKPEFDILLSEMTLSYQNRCELFEFLSFCGGEKFKVNMELLIEIIDGFLGEDAFSCLSAVKNTESGQCPSKSLVEIALGNTEIGEKGFVSVNEILREIKDKKRVKYFSQKIDPDRIGFLELPDLVGKLRQMYGTDLNINYKLCAQYLYKSFIKNPDRIDDFILRKTGEKSISNYLPHDLAYNSFMFAFCNDQTIFQNFYSVYKEKSGKFVGCLCLNSMKQFIISNNPELKYIEQYDLNLSQNSKFGKNRSIREEIESKDDIKSTVTEILVKKLVKAKDILSNIDISSCGITEDFAIKQKYFINLLKKKFGFSSEDIKIIVDYFKGDYEKINIKKLYFFDSENSRLRVLTIKDEIIPNIKEHIENAGYKSYKKYKKNIFKKDLLSIVDLWKLFEEIYFCNLYQCMILIGNEEFFSIDKFFSDYDLKNLFPEKEYEANLKSALMSLSVFFSKQRDALSVFRTFDSDRDGVLSYTEFLKALEQIPGLSLDEKQKRGLLNVADKDGRGKVDAKNFLKFVKGLRGIDEGEKEGRNKDRNNDELPRI